MTVFSRLKTVLGVTLGSLLLFGKGNLGDHLQDNLDDVTSIFRRDCTTCLRVCDALKDPRYEQCHDHMQHILNELGWELGIDHVTCDELVTKYFDEYNQWCVNNREHCWNDECPLLKYLWQCGNKYDCPSQSRCKYCYKFCKECHNNDECKDKLTNILQHLSEELGLEIQLTCKDLLKKYWFEFMFYCDTNPDHCNHPILQRFIRCGELKDCPLELDIPRFPTMNPTMRPTMRPTYGEPRIIDYINLGRDMQSHGYMSGGETSIGAYACDTTTGMNFGGDDETLRIGNCEHGTGWAKWNFRKGDKLVFSVAWQNSNTDVYIDGTLIGQISGGPMSHPLPCKEVSFNIPATVGTTFEVKVVDPTIGCAGDVQISHAKVINM